MDKRLLFNFLIVDERAVSRPSVSDEVAVAVTHNLSVVSRHFRAGQMQVASDPAADQKRDLLDRDDPAAEGIGNFESWL